MMFGASILAACASGGGVPSGRAPLFKGRGVERNTPVVVHGLVTILEV
jgi:hypothetical protein